MSQVHLEILTRLVRDDGMHQTTFYLVSLQNHEFTSLFKPTYRVAAFSGDPAFTIAQFQALEIAGNITRKRLVWICLLRNASRCKVATPSSYLLQFQNQLALCCRNSKNIARNP